MRNKLKKRSKMIFGVFSVIAFMLMGCAIHTTIPKHTQLSSPASAESATLPPDCNIVVYTDNGAKAIGWICAPAVPPQPKP